MGKIPWIEEIRDLDVKFRRSIELNVKNSEAIGLSVKYRNSSIMRETDYMSGLGQRNGGDTRKYSYLVTHVELAPSIVASCKGSSMS